jgi:hypothetical protein
MTVSQLIRRINKYWYVLLILPLIGAFLGVTSIANRTNYRSSITVGVSFNNPDFVFSGNENYDRQLNTLSEYLTNRFKSTDVQKKIIDIIDPNGGSDSRIDPKKPFYEIVDQKSGYVNISAVLPSQSQAKTFSEAIKTTYQNIVTLEKNQNELTNYKVTPMTNFSESISEVSTPVQFQVLPAIIGFLVAILIVSVLPLRN